MSYKFATWHLPTHLKFWTRIKVIPETGCWEWQSTLTQGGYGAFWHDLNKFTPAHRWSYQYFVGKISKGKIICHKCDVRKCVNPAHLYAGTHLDNANDRWGRGKFNDWKWRARIRRYNLGE